MAIKFPNYEDICNDSTSVNEAAAKVKERICQKIIAINNNKALSARDIERNLDLKHIDVQILKTKDFCVVYYFFELYNVGIKISLHINFDKNGDFTRWHAHYSGSNLKHDLENLLNINHFNDTLSYLQFSLNIYEGDEYNYELRRERDIRIPDDPHARVFIKYSFNADHVMYMRGFEQRGQNQSTSYCFEGYEKFETELMLLKFVKHVVKDKESANTFFVNYKDLDFSKADWFKKVEKMFMHNLISDKRAAFLDYMKLIDMIEI